MRQRILLLALLATVVLSGGLWLARRAAEKARVEARRSAPPVAEAPEPQGIRVFGRITAGGAPAQAGIVAHGSERSRFASGDSDEQGAYEFHVPEPGPYSFWIRLEEGVSVELAPQVVGLEEQRIDIEIPLGSIEGHVLGPDGPAVGIPVDLMAFEEDSHGKGRAAAKTTTDESGRYAVERLPAGSWVVQAGERATYEPPSLYTSSKFQRVNVASGQRVSGVDLSVGAAGIVSGRVLTAKGDPAEDAVLKIWPLSGVLRFSGGFDESDSEGRFVLGGIKPGSYRLVAFYGLRQAAEAQIVVEPSQELEVELRTAPATLVHVVPGSPDDGAQVTCKRSDGADCTGWLTWEADVADDEEVFGPLLPETYTFTVDRDGLPPSSQTVTLDAEREFRLEL